MLQAARKVGARSTRVRTGQIRKPAASHHRVLPTHSTTDPRSQNFVRIIVAEVTGDKCASQK